MTNIRIEIAKDSLAQLELNKLIPVNSRYIEPLSTKSFIGKISVKEVLQETQCKVCALGALFVGAVNRGNDLLLQDLVIPEFISYKEVFKVNEEYWTRDELWTIESAYEAWSPEVQMGEHDLSEESISTLYDFSVAEFVPEEKRMKLVLQNIIVNNGSFNPEEYLRNF